MKILLKIYTVISAILMSIGIGVILYGFSMVLIDMALPLHTLDFHAIKILNNSMQYNPIPSFGESFKLKLLTWTVLGFVIYLIGSLKWMFQRSNRQN